MNWAKHGASVLKSSSILCNQKTKLLEKPNYLLNLQVQHSNNIQNIFQFTNHLHLF